jgi:FtsP/CotA-like multicopper oxidase with cupredoxin domain
MFNGGPSTDTILVNGKGHYPNNPEVGSYFQTCFTPGKRHLMRLINGAASTSFVFSIDNHKLLVVASDFVPVEPFEVDSLLIGIGKKALCC